MTEFQKKLIEDFDCFPSWQDKYSYIIELGKELPLIDDAFKIQENIVEGCSSRVWLHCEFRDGRLFFTADSDAHIVKGLLTIVIKICSGKKKAEVLDINYERIFEDLGLLSHLTPLRSNGLKSVVKHIEILATKF